MINTENDLLEFTGIQKNMTGFGCSFPFLSPWRREPWKQQDYWQPNLQELDWQCGSRSTARLWLHGYTLRGCGSLHKPTGPSRCLQWWLVSDTTRLAIKKNYKPEKESRCLLRKYREVELQWLHCRQHSTRMMLPQGIAKGFGSPSKQAGSVYLKTLQNYF